MLLVIDPRIAGELQNTRPCNALAWTTFVTITLAVGTLLLDRRPGLFGKHLL